MMCQKKLRIYEHSIPVKDKKRIKKKVDKEQMVSKWPYFECLRFLDEVVAPKKSISNIQVHNT